MNAEARLTAKLQGLGIELPLAPAPKGVYRPLVVIDRLLHTKLAYTAGHLPVKSDGELIVGRVGGDLSLDQGYEAAMYAGLGILATLRKELETLNHVRRVVKLIGFVQCTPEFHQQPAVLNGCSDLWAEIFGPENGVGARSAIGAVALPLGVAVEVEAIFEIG
jgi:hypothetical protein